MMTISEILYGLNLSYAHVAVRRKLDSGFDYLGGGTIERVLSRFGNLEVKESNIMDNVLIFYVV